MMALCISKSMTTASGCETYLDSYYLHPVPALRQSVAAIAITGQQFHAYRRAYLNRLIDLGVPTDQRWALDWLAAQGFTDDARKMIELDIDRFSVNPDLVAGVEIYLSVDEDFKPLDRIDNYETPGRYGLRHKDAAWDGTIDLLLREGDVAIVVDSKSGFSTAGVSDSEPPHYAMLVFAMWPGVQTVRFRWEFIRFRAMKEVEYTRRHVPQLLKSLRSTRSRIEDVLARSNRGEQLAVNAHAGLCAFCSILCPLKKALPDTVDLPPLQTLEDAKRIAALTYIARIVASRGSAALRDWIDANGPVELPNDWVTSVAVSQRKELMLADALQVLGLEVAPLGTLFMGGIDPPALSPRYQVPLDKLQVRTTQLAGYSKARKREGLAEELIQIAKLTPISRVKIARAGEEIEDAE